MPPRRLPVLIRRMIHSGILISCAPLPAAPPALPGGSGAKWEVLKELSSEFDGTRLESDKFFDWLPLQFFDTGETQKDLQHHADALFRPDNTSVKDGWLHLTVKQDQPRVQGLTGIYSLPALTTKKLLRNGYIEVRAVALPGAFVSAFWLNKQNTAVRQPLSSPWITGPYQGGNEIDVFEILGNSRFQGIDWSRRNNLNCLVYGDLQPPADGVADNNTNELSHTEYDLPAAAPSFIEKPHVFGLEWDDTSLKWYVDGELKRTTTQSDVSWQVAQYNAPGEPTRGTGHRFAGTRFAPHLFNLPLQVMLNVEYVPGWHGPVNPADLPAAMRVDYLRVWQKRGTGPELVRNGSFSQATGWRFILAPDALAELQSTGGRSLLRIRQSGTTPDSIRLQQSSLRLQAGTPYSLSYEASATRPHWFLVSLTGPDGQALARYREFIPQDGTLQNGHSAIYSHIFQTPGKLPPGFCTLTFSAGGPDDPGEPQDQRVLWIDDVSLRAMPAIAGPGTLPRKLMD